MIVRLGFRRPYHSSLLVLGLALGLLGCARTLAAPPAESTPPSDASRLTPDFRGWQGLRVIEQVGYPQRMTAADLDSDGKDELLVVNPRQARIEIYRHQPNPPDDDATAGSDRPNELPMAPDIERIEVGLEKLPLDVIAHDLDGDDTAELLVLVRMPNRVEVYRSRSGVAGYEKARSIDLLEGDYAGRDALMLLETAGERPTLLISMSRGIQRLPVSLDEEADGAAARPTWVEPKQTINRADWWLGDLDGDGDRDLIEWTSEAERSVRWMPRVDGRLMPPQTLHDELVNQAVVFRGASGAAEVALLGGVQSGVLRHYRLGEDEPGPVGRRQVLALDDPAQSPWCIVRVEDKPMLVAVDPEQPELNTFTLDDDGWQAGPTYPIVTDVEQIVPVTAQPGTLLLRVKDAAHLYRSQWDGERFTYPTRMHNGGGLHPPGEQHEDADSKPEADQAMLNLGLAGMTTWWTRRVGGDVVLHQVHGPSRQSPAPTVFTGLGTKVKEALWLGGDRLLVNDQYARQPKLVTLVDGETKIAEPPHLKSLKTEELRLFTTHGGELRLGRLTEGVLQWLDQDLQPTDQVMLPEGARLAAFVFDLETEDQAWALQTGGQRIHHLAPDEAGILRVSQTYRVPGGQDLIRAWDPAVGLLLIGRDGLTRLSEGSSRKLELAQSIDSREGRPSGVREATIHRLFANDVTGAGHEQLILVDDLRHQLTLLDAVKPESEDEADDDNETATRLEATLSWPVFEDAKYPYGYDDASMGGEPRRLTALDLDGDGRRDLALLSHDRLILYLGETP
ncbi:MAG: hypothetical protein GVY24_06140 [Planctomycetes bacterium]|jgi:hypothetical protein|nr:hypothetical protein [Planctomycetota bacterium]